MDNVAILLEHVDLLNRLDWLDVHLLQSSLQLLVIGSGGLVDFLHLAAGSSLSTARIVYVVSHTNSYCRKFSIR